MSLEDSKFCSNQEILSLNETALLAARLQITIDFVLDSVKGKRSLRNLWGLNPVKSQTLVTMGVGERVSYFIIGGHIESRMMTFNDVDQLVHSVIDPYKPVRDNPDTGTTRKGGYRHIRSITSFLSPIGIKFERIAIEETADESEPQTNLPSIGHFGHSLIWEVSAISNDKRR